LDPEHQPRHWNRRAVEVLGQLWLVEPAVHLAELEPAGGRLCLVRPVWPGIRRRTDPVRLRGHPDAVQQHRQREQ
jgi:hypothetical protein